MKRSLYFYFFLLLSILFFGFFLRIFGINWDAGHYFHPDERAIAITTASLSFPSTLAEFFSPESPLNPHFFAYGSFPIYMLKFFSYVASAFDPLLGVYEKIYFVGRSLSAIADTLTILLVYLLSLTVFRKQAVAIFSSLFYALAVLPIQTSHFFVVDIFLTLFVALTLYRLVRYMDSPSFANVVLIGGAFGMALATKISAAPLFLPLGFAFIFTPFSKGVYTQIRKKFSWKTLLMRFRNPVLHFFTATITTILFFLLFSPYVIIDWEEFLRQTQEQARMTESAFTFPYTLQYVGKIPYVYELQNIFLWGLGPVTTIFAVIGLFFAVYAIFKNPLQLQSKKLFIILSFFAVYFYIVGGFAVGWMRYMLPLYPILCMLAGYLAYTLAHRGTVFVRHTFKNKTILSSVILSGSGVVFLLAVLTWPLSFMQIYTQPNTRVLASQWIYQHISNNKTLAIEHWDDELPVGGDTHYQKVVLPMYEADTSEKWSFIDRTLDETDYIIIASNRLYKPLQRLSNCEEIYPHTCYPVTAQYYKELFSEKRGFTKVAEFTSYPTIPLFNIPINDQWADESFTVYDHPKVIIFQKENE